MVKYKKVIALGCIVLFLLILTGVAFFFHNNKKLTYLSISTSPILKITTLKYILPILIKGTCNFSEHAKSFTIQKDTSINIFAIGEGASTATSPYLLKSYNSDAVEVFFDLKNQKKQSFDLNADDRLYRFLWKLSIIDGRNIDTNGVKIIEENPTRETYTMKIIFPWKTLGYVNPKKGTKIGFDVALVDCNSKNGKSLISWHSKKESWNNTSYFGSLVLNDSKKTKLTDSVVSCVYTFKNPFNQKISPNIWSKYPSYKFKYINLGTVKDTSDLSGNFKALWDKQNLYLLVNVRDDVKEYENTMFDYGWIEDMKGKIIWKMIMPQTTHAGGALKNRQVNTTIKIKKGKYVLKYKTDESHSTAQWDDAPPISSFYGIKINL